MSVHAFRLLRGQGLAEGGLLTLHVEHAGNVGALRLGEHPAVKGLVVVLKDLGWGRLIHAEVVDGKGKSHGVGASGLGC